MKTLDINDPTIEVALCFTLSFIVATIYLIIVCISNSKKMKTFYLSYTTITGHEVKLTFTEPFAFAEALERALNDEYVNQHSFTIRTEEND